MKQKIFAVFAAALLLLGMTDCTSNVDNPSPVDTTVLEQSLVGLWWDEFEYADVTEAGVPFSRVMLAVKADADHTGCIYLGVFDNTSDEPLMAVNALLKAFQDKDVELKEFNPFK